MFLKVCSKLNWLRGFCGRSSIKLLLDGSEDDGSIRCSIRNLSGTRGLNRIPKHKERILPHLLLNLNNQKPRDDSSYFGCSLDTDKCGNRKKSMGITGA